jgi:hypothetical protein
MEAEAQLECIASALDGGAALLSALKSINERHYQRLTSDFRNRESHAIAPHLTVGHTNLVVRRVVAGTTEVQQPDGTYKIEPIPGTQRVSYGYGGTLPLKMRDVFTANLTQLEHASTCFHAYVDVLNKSLARLPRRKKLSETAALS